jgi:hypothetical protein
MDPQAAAFVAMAFVSFVITLAVLIHEGDEDDGAVEYIGYTLLSAIIQIVWPLVLCAICIYYGTKGMKKKD